eukprot:CAMPEP_0177584942 /NCGR_PEP_ID=MMETSP0419_2-20121207/4194_1 /TAXON_ID=582737 /ORGANISM="Tetraselmis sp., Strain GSL018" /LENGTH=659 /DNA_ID=CAMNT_0019074573 /DNA_START=442 /DNA_END=2422 /DNA_ORIENTATION=+
MGPHAHADGHPWACRPNAREEPDGRSEQLAAGGAEAPEARDRPDPPLQRARGPRRRDGQAPVRARDALHQPVPLPVGEERERAHLPVRQDPETVIIRNGEIRFWFYLSDTGNTTRGETHEIKRKSQEECTRGNVKAELNEEIFPSKGNPNGKNSIRAMHIAPPLAEHNFDSAEYGIEIDYLDKEKLNQLINAGGLPEGLLQQYVRPFSDQNVIFMCNWKPHFFYVSRITSEISGYHPNGVLKDGSKTTKMKTGDVTDTLCKRLQQTCDAIASHVYEVSPQKYKIDGMCLGFKKDHLGNLWLLFCNELMVSKLSDCPPLISKPRNYQISRNKFSVAKPKKPLSNRHIYRHDGKNKAKQETAGSPGSRASREADESYSSEENSEEDSERNDSSSEELMAGHTRPSNDRLLGTVSSNSAKGLIPSPTSFAARRQPRQAPIVRGVQSGSSGLEGHQETPKSGLLPRPPSVPQTSRAKQRSDLNKYRSKPSEMPPVPRHERHKPYPTYKGAISSRVAVRPHSATGTDDAKTSSEATGSRRKQNQFRVTRLYECAWESQDGSDLPGFRRTMAVSPYLESYVPRRNTELAARGLKASLARKIFEHHWDSSVRSNEKLVEKQKVPAARRPRTTGLVNKSLRVALSVYNSEAKSRRASSARTERNPHF